MGQINSTLMGFQKVKFQYTFCSQISHYHLYLILFSTQFKLQLSCATNSERGAPNSYQPWTFQGVNDEVPLIVFHVLVSISDTAAPVSSIKFSLRINNTIYVKSSMWIDSKQIYNVIDHVRVTVPCLAKKARGFLVSLSKWAAQGTAPGIMPLLLTSVTDHTLHLVSVRVLIQWLPIMTVVCSVNSLLVYPHLELGHPLG